jgi:hypothetical protein
MIVAMMAGLAAPVWAETSVNVSDGDSVSNTESRTPTLSEQIPVDDTKQKHDQFFTFNWENDKFGGNSDRHYTNGLRLTYFDALDKPPEWAEKLSDAVPMFDLGEKSGVYYSFGQNIYTPDNIRVVNPAPGQRPYAGFLYGSMGFTTLEGDKVDDYQLTLGVVGPAALGEQVQKRWHEIVNVPKPLGWDNYQLHNEPIVNLTWQQRYPEALSWQSSGGDWYAAAEPHYGFALGNAYTYGNAGFMLRFGPASSRWQDTPPLVQPSLPGNGYFLNPNGGFSWYVFAGTDVRLVARNIFLDGNTFEDSPSVDKRILVADLTTGVATTFGKYRITYALNQRTREYDTQHASDVYGAISLGYRF